MVVMIFTGLCTEAGLQFWGARRGSMETGRGCSQRPAGLHCVPMLALDTLCILT